MARAFAKIAFTRSVQQAQGLYGAPKAYADFLEGAANHGACLGPDEAAFIAARDGFYQASVSETGWPYVQFRGGPAGFLKVLDDCHLAYADFSGNRQYISTGNLSVNDRLSLILMDYPARRRMKIWARARVLDGDEAAPYLDVLRQPDARAKAERVVLMRVEAFDWNCPQHIPQRLTVAEYAPYLAPLQQEIARLQAQLRACQTAAAN